MKEILIKMLEEILEHEDTEAGAYIEYFCSGSPCTMGCKKCPWGSLENVEKLIEELKEK